MSVTKSPRDFLSTLTWLGLAAVSRLISTVSADDPYEDKSDSTSMNGNAIAGIVIGAIIFIGVTIWYCVKRYEKAEAAKPEAARQIRFLEHAPVAINIDPDDQARTRESTTSKKSKSSKKRKMPAVAAEVENHSGDAYAPPTAAAI